MYSNNTGPKIYVQEALDLHMIHLYVYAETIILSVAVTVCVRVEEGTGGGGVRCWADLWQWSLDPSLPERPICVSMSLYVPISSFS